MRKTKICLWRTRQLRKFNFRMCRQSVTNNSIFITNSMHVSAKSSERAEEQTLNFAFETCLAVELTWKWKELHSSANWDVVIWFAAFPTVKYEWYCYFNSHGISYLAKKCILVNLCNMLLPLFSQDKFLANLLSPKIHENCNYNNNNPVMKYCIVAVYCNDRSERKWKKMLF